MDDMHLTDTVILREVKPFLPAGPIAINEQRWAAQLLEDERKNSTSSP